MRAAGNIEEQAMRRIERDERRIAVAPVGELFEERMVGRLVGLGDDKIGNGAARIGKARAQADAPPLGIPSRATTRSALLIFATTASGVSSSGGAREAAL